MIKLLTVLLATLSLSACFQEPKVVYMPDINHENCSKAKQILPELASDQMREDFLHKCLARKRWIGEPPKDVEREPTVILIKPDGYDDKKTPN